MFNQHANLHQWPSGALQTQCCPEEPCQERDAVADAFETFIGPSLKGGQGQFFTPRNVVKLLYKQFTTEEISNKIAQLITPAGLDIPVDVIFQSIEDLHKSCPNNLGDWYFTGNYPTAGGNKVVNKAFMNYMEGKNVRGY